MVQTTDHVVLQDLGQFFGIGLQTGQGRIAEKVKGVVVRSKNSEGT